MNKNGPFVSIVTPVYNGEEFLAECIESVLTQTFRHWEYIVVNNCSTDRSLEIAEGYARKDKRIRVRSYAEFVGVIESYNRSLRLLSSQSKYCKVVSADDCLMPYCVEKMVSLVESNPTVGIVGSYQLCRDNVIWNGLPTDLPTMSGRTVCRRLLLEHLPVHGNQTSSLYSADFIRRNGSFFPHQLPYADRSALYEYLQYCDFGFVHEVLSIQRTHNAQVTSRVDRELGMWNIGLLDDFYRYGRMYLTEREFQARERQMLGDYYRWLSTCILKMKSKAFWRFQESRLREHGCRIRWSEVLMGLLSEIGEEIQNPKVAFGKFMVAIRERHRGKNFHKSAESF
jgi:glycosyltransferase involved in cell wall biosynthesis